MWWTIKSSQKHGLQYRVDAQACFPGIKFFSNRERCGNDRASGSMDLIDRRP